MLIVDGHQDLSWNMVTFERDYTLSAVETRRREQGGRTPERNGDTLLGWPEYQRGQVRVIFSTLFAAPARRSDGDWDRLSYRDYNEAHACYRLQLDRYHRLFDEHSDKFCQVDSRASLQSVLEEGGHPEAEGGPVGLVLLMEGAEGVREPAELEEWWQGGVRLIGPAWAGTRFCGGTREPGPLTPDGYALLEGMADLGFILDISHMDEPAVFQALDTYPRQVIASHANARALLKGSESNRHLNDRVIRSLVERDGVIGVVPINPFLLPGWRRGDRREEVTLDAVIAHIDHICQLAGDARHVGFGTDFDGGFGMQSAPIGIDTIADLQKFAPLLSEKGYTQEDIAAIFGQNWVSMLMRSLPE